jgi:hypothetical protein
MWLALGSKPTPGLTQNARPEYEAKKAALDARKTAVASTETARR